MRKQTVGVWCPGCGGATYGEREHCDSCNRLLLPHRRPLTELEAQAWASEQMHLRSAHSVPTDKSVERTLFWWARSVGETSERSGTRVAYDWNERIGTGFLVFGLVTVVAAVLGGWIAGMISCWGVDADYQPARYCAYGSVYGLLVAPIIGLLAAAFYVVRDLDRRDREKGIAARTWQLMDAEGLSWTDASQLAEKEAKSDS